MIPIQTVQVIMKNQVNISLLVCLVFFQLACGISVKSTSTESDSENVIKSPDNNFLQNLQLWKDKEISSYSFVISRFGGGQYGRVPVAIEVSDNKVISLKPARKKLELERIDGYEDFETFDKLFARIDDSYKRKHRIEVVYNKELGYPEKVRIDDGKTNHSAYYLEISNFKVAKNKLQP